MMSVGERLNSEATIILSSVGALQYGDLSDTDEDYLLTHAMASAQRIAFLASELLNFAARRGMTAVREKTENLLCD